MLQKSVVDLREVETNLREEHKLTVAVHEKEILSMKEATDKTQTEANLVYVSVIH